MTTKEAILNGKTTLGIELGSTRIKAILIDEECVPIASGSYDWENRYVNGIWTYQVDDIWTGLQACYKYLKEMVHKQYNVTLHTVGAIGFSAMMHGYMVFDENDKLLAPFRTWRNTITEMASDELTELFHYNIPQRWSIAHLYQAILNEEEHVSKINYITTLAGYVHWKMTEEKVLGVGDASGMFPIDIEKKTFNNEMIVQFNELIADKKYTWKLDEIFPKVLLAGDEAGVLTEKGAKLLDPFGDLRAGIPVCSPEGDAQTGMVATNSVAVRTGNVSAGTSVFSMVVLEHELSKVYRELDMVTTPDGSLVAMAHCNNCTSDLNAWVGIFEEFSKLLDVEIEKNRLYELLYNKALAGDLECGGLLSYNYFSGEHITGFNEGRPLFVRTPECNFNLANFMRVNLFTSLGALKQGMDLLLKDENVKLEQLLGHGGLFKTKIVGQKIMAAAMNTPVTVMETAGEGGAWGIAVLASYMINKMKNSKLETYLLEKVFDKKIGSKVDPDKKDVEGFEQFMERYKKGFPIEKAAIEVLR